MLLELTGANSVPKTRGGNMSDSFHIENIIAKSRRAYTCRWCGTCIDPGSTVIKISGKFDSVMFRFHIHTDCSEAWLRDPCNQAGEACYGGHLRGMTCEETM